MNTAGVVPLLPSVTVTSLMLSTGAASSSLIVPTPCPFPIVACVGALRFTTKLRSLCLIVFPSTWTVIVLLVSPGLNVSAPLAAW